MHARTETFSSLFRKYRLRSEFSTLAEFGQILATEGFDYEDSIFSRWQKGDRIPRNRVLLITLVRIFIKRGSMTSIEEANSFLECAGQGYATSRELSEITQLFDVSLQVNHDADRLTSSSSQL